MARTLSCAQRHERTTLRTAARAAAQHRGRGRSGGHDAPSAARTSGAAHGGLRAHLGGAGEEQVLAVRVAVPQHDAPTEGRPEPPSGARQEAPRPPPQILPRARARRLSTAAPRGARAQRCAKWRGVTSTSAAGSSCGLAWCSAASDSSSTGKLSAYPPSARQHASRSAAPSFIAPARLSQSARSAASNAATVLRGIECTFPMTATATGSRRRVHATLTQPLGQH